MSGMTNSKGYVNGVLNSFIDKKTWMLGQRRTTMRPWMLYHPLLRNNEKKSKTLPHALLLCPLTQLPPMSLLLLHVPLHRVQKAAQRSPACRYKLMSLIIKTLTLLKPSERVALVKESMRSKSKKKLSSSKDWVIEQILAHDHFMDARHEELLTAL
jgi:hypothetical protein